MPLEVQADYLPAELVAAIGFNLGPLKAKEWLVEAAATANKHASIWGVSFDTVLTGGALSLCIAGTDARGVRVVMKVPTNADSGRQEIAALRSWGKAGCPHVIATNDDNSVFLMEYLYQTEGVIDADEVFLLAQSLHEVIPSPNFRFPKLSENVDMRIKWAEDRFDADEYAHLRSDLDAAKAISRRLLDTASEEVLLHGDFQRKNLIVTPAGLRTLDPHACVGDPVFDAAFWVGLVHHDQTLADLLVRYPAEQESVEFRRFFCWTWAISVIENRPYQERGVDERQEFIAKFRASAIESATYL